MIWCQNTASHADAILLTSAIECTFMDRYESLDPELLPPLWLIYTDSPSDSGKVHSDVRQRWHQGDRAVHEAMARFASFAEKGRCAHVPPALTLQQTGRDGEMFACVLQVKRQLLFWKEFPADLRYKIATSVLTLDGGDLKASYLPCTGQPWRKR